MLQEFDPARTLDLAAGVAAAFLFAVLIGAERQWRQRSAGLRTNVLVAVGASAFVSLGLRLNGNPGATQVVAYVVSGVGFLGAGAIMKEGAQVFGLNTAATLWCCAAVGALSGAGFVAEAAILTVAVLAGNTLLRPLVNAINRAPVDETTGEATLELWAASENDNVGEVRDLVVEALERANYPVQDIEIEPRGEETSEVVATLIATSGERSELDAVCAELERSPLVTFASWGARTGETG